MAPPPVAILAAARPSRRRPGRGRRRTSHPSSPSRGRWRGPGATACRLAAGGEARLSDLNTTPCILCGEPPRKTNEQGSVHMTNDVGRGPRRGLVAASRPRPQGSFPLSLGLTLSCSCVAGCMARPERVYDKTEGNCPGCAGGLAEARGGVAAVVERVIAQHLPRGLGEARVLAWPPGHGLMQVPRGLRARSISLRSDHLQKTR